ncbi:MAG: TRAP transporter substrate-binding protein [Gemmatimonadota bacterium]
MRRRVITAALLCAACGTDAPVETGTGTEPGLVFRLANELTPDSKIGDVSFLFKERLEQASPDGSIRAGEIEVVLYDQGMVGTERQLLENAYFGVMEVVQINSSVVSTIDHAFNLFDLPYIFVSQAHHREILQGEVGQVFLDRLQDFRLRGLGFYGLGFRALFYKAPADGCIERPEDLRGLKLRVIESPIMINSINAMGASATPVPFSEQFQALKTGVIDGADNAARVFISHRFYETGTNCFTQTEHFTNQHVLVANNDWFQSLEPKYQRRILDVSRQIIPEFRAVWDAATQEALDQMEGVGVTVNAIENKQPFMDRTENVSTQFLRDYPSVPRELYDRIRAASGEVQ